MNVDLKITAANVPADLQHKTRALEIAELPQFLKVSMNTGPNGQLSFINYGSQYPSEDNTDKPWVRVDPSSGTAGLFFFFDGSWLPVTGGQLNPTVGPLAVTPTSPVTITGTQYITVSGGYPPYTWTNVVPRACTISVGGRLNNQAAVTPSYLQTSGSLLIMDSAGQIITCDLTMSGIVDVVTTPATNIPDVGRGTWPFTFSITGTGVTRAAPYVWTNNLPQYFICTPASDSLSMTISKNGSPALGNYNLPFTCFDKYGKNVTATGTLVNI
jgi:hypothetical protein